MVAVCVWQGTTAPSQLAMLTMPVPRGGTQRALGHRAALHVRQAHMGQWQECRGAQCAVWGGMRHRRHPQPAVRVHTLCTVEQQRVE